MKEREDLWVSVVLAKIERGFDVDDAIDDADTVMDAYDEHFSGKVSMLVRPLTNGCSDSPDDSA